MKSLLILIFLLLATLAHATTYWVSTTGNNANSCASTSGTSDPGTYRQTITSGISCLSAGDTLRVKAGTYSAQVVGDSIPSGSSAGARTIIQGAGIGQTILIPGSGDEAGFFFNTATKNHIEIRDFEVAAGSVGFGIYVDGTKDDMVFRNIKIYDAGDQNIYTHDNMTNFQFISVETINAGTQCVAKHAGNGFCHGIYMHGGDGFTIEKSIFRSSDGNGIQSYADNVVIKNSIAYDNYSAGFGIFGGAAKIYNTSTTNNNLGPFGYAGIFVNAGGGSSEIKNNIAYLNNGDDIINNTGAATASNQTTNPTWVNLAGHNFQLQSGSNAIGTGTDLSGSGVSDDFAGVSRPQGGTWDKGAFEFVGGGGAPTNLTVSHARIYNMRSSSTSSPENNRYPLAAIDANATLKNASAFFAIRTKIKCTGGDCPMIHVILRYQKNDTGGYVNVNNTCGADNLAFVGTANTSADITADGTATTEQLTSDFSTNVAGMVRRTNSPISNLDLSQDSETEVEHILQICSGGAPVGTTFDFRPYISDGNALDNYTITPRVTLTNARFMQ